MTSDDVLWLLVLAMVTGPLWLDPTQQITNVHWDDGLAVEFFSGAA